MVWLKYLINKFKILFSNTIIIWDKCPTKNELYQQIADSTVRIAHDTLMENNYYDGRIIHDSIAEDALWDAYINFSAYIWQIPENNQHE